MCGIVGYTGPNPCVEILVDGLRRLEYRGYDSAGIAVLADGDIAIRKSEGKGALIGAGSTITKNVPPYALALCRAEQKTFDLWVARKKPELLKKAGLAVPAVKKGEK
jgi:glutamine phosphoribosylpyrophosphate amidotransferase